MMSMSMMINTNIFIFHICDIFLSIKYKFLSNIDSISKILVI